MLSGSINVLEDSNGNSLTDYRGHNRNYGFTATLNPRERFGFDFAYNYNDYLQNALICFNDTPPVGVTLPVVTGAASCAANDASNPLQTSGYYSNNSHFAMVSVTFEPVKRVTSQAEYSITSVDGKTPQFNVLQPDGSLRYNYHQPLANFRIDLGHNLAWNAGWSYYQYNESSFVGPTAARYFHANTRRSLCFGPSEVLTIVSGAVPADPGPFSILRLSAHPVIDVTPHREVTHSREGDPPPTIELELVPTGGCTTCGYLGRAPGSGERGQRSWKLDFCI